MIQHKKEKLLLLILQPYEAILLNVIARKQKLLYKTMPCNQNSDNTKSQINMKRNDGSQETEFL